MWQNCKFQLPCWCYFYTLLLHLQIFSACFRQRSFGNVIHIKEQLLEGPILSHSIIDLSLHQPIFVIHMTAAVVIHEGDGPKGLFRLYLHANSPKCNASFSALQFLRNYSSENKFPANVLASAGMKVCIGTKIFSRIQSRPIAAENTFSPQKVQHFESAFASICRPDQPCGVGMFIVICLNFAFAFIIFGLI